MEGHPGGSSARRLSPQKRIPERFQYNLTIHIPPNVQPLEPLDPEILATAAPEEQKFLIGERLFPLVNCMYPQISRKITGMLLELENMELLHLLENRESLVARVEEAVSVLQAYQAQQVANRSGAPMN